MFLESPEVGVNFVKIEEAVKSDVALSRRKQLSFSLILVFCLWLFLDIAVYVVLKKVSQDSNYQVFHRIETPTSEYLDKFHSEDLWPQFHPQWGWDGLKQRQGSLGNRRSRDYEQKEEYKIKAFGDSFTFGADVKNNETFEYIIEEKTGWECLNYGVGAYGTDQALLKYKDNRIRTQYTLLGILDENVARCVNVWLGYYWTTKKFTKPRFAISEDGAVFLVNNPIQSSADGQKLKDIAFVNSLKRYDYWANYWERVNAPQELKWPATVTVFSHLGFFVRNTIPIVTDKLLPTYESATAQAEFYHLYSRDSEGFKIMCYIVDEFIATADLKGEIPIVVVFPLTYSVDVLSKYGRSPYESLVDYLEEIECHFIDFGGIFRREEYINYYLRHGGHFSVEGNEKVADELIACIQRLEDQ